MASVTDLRNGLATRLATISGLHDYARVPKTVNLPAAIVQPAPDSAIMFDAAGARASDDFMFVITLLVTDAVDEIGQAALDPYLAGSGAQSIKTVIEADGTLGGAAQWVRVTGVRNYGLIEQGGIQYLGAEFVVEVMA